MRWTKGKFSSLFGFPKHLRSFALVPIMLNAFNFLNNKSESSSVDPSKLEAIKGSKDGISSPLKASPNSQLFQIPIQKDKIEKNKIYKFKINDDLKIIFICNESGYCAFYGGCPSDDSELSDILIRDKIFCSKHGEIFCASTGRLEYGPVLEDLEQLQVMESEDNIFVLVPQVLQKKVFEYKKPVKVPDFRRFVVIGNDVSSLSAIQTIRREGFVGELYFILHEDDKLPFNWRSLFEPGNDPVYKTEAFLRALNVTLIKNVEIKAININNSSIELENRAPIRFDKVIMANSFVPSAVHNPKLPETFNSLNTQKDYEQFIQNSKNLDALEIEGNIVECLELACLLHNYYKNIVTNKKDEYNLKKIIVKDRDLQQWVSDLIDLPEIQKELKQLTNIDLVIASSADEDYEIKSKSHGRSKVIRIGPKFIISDALIHQDIYKWDPNKHNSILVDVCLQHLKERIYVAGNLTSYPFWYTADKINLKNNPSESIYQGKVVGKNIMGSKMGYHSIPFQSYKLLNKQLNVVGIPDYCDQYFLSPDGKIAYFLRDGNLAAAATFEKFDELMVLRFGMLFNRLPQLFYFQTDPDISKKIAQKLEKKYMEN